MHQRKTFSLEPAKLIPSRHLSTATSSGDALRQVVNRIANVASVSQVTSSNDKSATANTVRDIAESQSLLIREVGDLATLLAVASVAVENNTSDLLLDGIVEALHGGGHDGRALAVAAGDDDGVRALAGGQVEEALRLAVGGAGGAFGQGVGAHARGVGAADALAGDTVCAVLLLQA